MQAFSTFKVSSGKQSAINRDFRQGEEGWARLGLPRHKFPVSLNFPAESRDKNNSGIKEQKLVRVVNAEKNEISGITGTTQFWGFLQPVLLRICPTTVKLSLVCSAKPGPQRLHSGFSSSPGAVECFNQSQSEMFRSPVLPSWRGVVICPIFWGRIMTHARCCRVKASLSFSSSSSKPRSETGLIPSWTGIKRGISLLCTPENSPQTPGDAGAGRTKEQGWTDTDPRHNIHESVAVYLLRGRQEPLRSSKALQIYLQSGI